jgi:hypothetical protein
MAISYPLNTPTTIGIESIELRAVNAVAVSQSPFTYKQQVISHQGQIWSASVSIPSVRRDLAAEWKAMLVALKGPVGTFLLGDPDYVTPRGTINGSATLSGNAGDATPTITLTGTLLAGDYIQLGTGSAARLHQVLVDRAAGTDVELEVWPSLRSTYSGETVIYNSPKGVFRLGQSTTSWSIDNASFYGISFDAIEALQ